MAIRLIPLILLGVTLSPFTTQAWGQEIECAERTPFVTMLADKHKESQRAIGISRGGVIELWQSSDGRTFTIILSLPSGMTCPFASGIDWQPLPLPVKGYPS